MGPDGPASWAIAASCCFINMMLYGMTRLNGFLFVASMDRYRARREETSFSYTFANFVRNTSGPLVGYLGQKLGVRSVTTLGCLLAAIGVGTCFLAESVGTITFLWGILYGLGFGLGSSLLPVKINQYFDKHRATASGISFAGSCLGSFILPTIFENLVYTYSLSGTFLMLAGLVLQCVPAALLLRKPAFVVKQVNQQKYHPLDDEKESITHGIKFKLYTLEDKEIQGNAYENVALQYQKFSKSISMDSIPQDYEKNIKTLPIKTLVSNNSIRTGRLDSKKTLQPNKGRHDSQIVVDYEKENLASKNSNLETKRTLKDNVTILKEDKSHTSCPFIWKPTTSTLMYLPSPKNVGKEHSKCLVDDSKNHHYSRSLDGQLNYRYQPDTDEKSHIKTCRTSVKSSSPSSVFSIVYDPIFVLIVITNAFYLFSFVCMVTVMVDFAKDIGVSEANEKYILMSMSIGDFVGRLGLGWLTDGGHMTKTMFASVCFLGQALTTTAIAWSTGFVTLTVLIASYGFSQAGLIVIFPLIVTEFIDEDKLTVAISSAGCLGGPLCLVVAPLIGYFRDELGSYKYFFCGIGLLSAVCSFAWLLTSCIVKIRKARERLGS